MVKVREDRELGMDRQHKGRRRLRARTGWIGSISLGLWASTGWAQEPPADPPPPADAPVAPAEAAPPAAAPPAADAPAVDAPPPPSADGSVVDAPSMDLEVGDPDSGPSGATAPGMDEVVITVDRRRKNLQDYSGTAAAFSESQLTNLGVSNVSNLSQVVPGLQISVNDQGSSAVYIRGVGSDNTTELGDPAVAVHLDNVYIPRVRGFNAAYLDVERVEVNSGPQGTVRGRNASGGSINIISKKAALGEYQGNAEITFGTYQQRAYQGMINIPLGDHLAIRAAGASTSIDETWENVGPLTYLPGAQDTNDYALKGQLRFKPTAALDMTLAGDYTSQRGAGYFGANVQNLFTNRNNNGTPDILNDDPAVPIDPNSVDDPRKVWRRGRYPEVGLEHWGVRFDATYDAGPVTFELLTSYRAQDWKEHGGSAAGFYVDPSTQPGTFTASTENLAFQQWDNWSFAQQQEGTSDSFVGEFRIASPDDQQLVWSVGLFGFHEDQGAFLGQVTGDPGGYNEFNMPSTVSRSFAVYGDATFKVTPDFRLLAGLRWTTEHKDRLGGLWMIGNGLPTNGLDLCGAQNAMGQCTQLGLANGGIGRFGTEGMEFEGLDRDNYNVPAPTRTPTPASQTERVNFFLDGVKSFGARDQTAIALCNDPEPIQQTNAEGMPGNIVPDESRLELIDGQYRCRYGVRDNILNSTQNFNDSRAQNGRNNNSYIDFRAGLEYDLAKDNLLYATLSSGHKAGGFNDSFPNPDAPDEYLTPGYGPETAYALEIGSKNLLLDRKLRINASAFGYAYKGLQFQTIITVGEPPPLDSIGNVRLMDNGMPFPDNRGGAAVRQNAKETAMIYGLDVDAVYALPLGFEIDLHPLLMDARFPKNTYVNDDRLGLGTAPAQVNIGSNWLPRVSPFTLNYSLSQLIWTEAGTFDWIFQGQTRGQHFFNAFNGDGTKFEDRGPGWGINPITGMPAPIEATDGVLPDGTMYTANAQYAVLANNVARLDDHVPTYSTFNLGFGWRRPDGLMSVRGFVNNVFNVTHATGIVSQSGFNSRFFNDPRMMGVRVRMDF
ncbi:MAG: TonB-dependent receptor [Deltaproteobacteria bacterium]